MSRRLPQIVLYLGDFEAVPVVTIASLVFDRVGFSLSTAAHGGKEVVLCEAGGRRSAGFGHTGPPQLNGIDLFNTTTMDGDYVTDAHSVLVACAARGAPEWPSEWPPAAHTPGIASHMCVPLAMASAGHCFGQPQPASSARRDDGGLGAVCVTTTMWPAGTQEAIARVSRVVRG